MSFEEVDIEVNVADITPFFLVPNCSSPANILEIGTSTKFLPSTNLNTTARYVLPDKSNLGKLPNKYSPKINVKRSKYFIANYMPTHKLSKSHRLSAICRKHFMD